MLKWLLKNLLILMFFFKCLVIWQLSQYNQTKLFWMKFKTTKCYYSHLMEKTKQTIWPTQSNTIDYIPCFTSPWLFCDYQFVLINPFSFSPSSSNTPSSGNNQSVLCIYESVSILFFHLYCSLDYTYKWNHTVFISPWLTYFIIHSRSIHTVTNVKI